MVDGERVHAELLAGAPLPGDVIEGKYRVERVIGVGGMGFVVAAHHTFLDQRVAVKMIRGSEAGGDAVPPNGTDRKVGWQLSPAASPGGFGLDLGRSW